MAKLKQYYYFHAKVLEEARYKYLNILCDSKNIYVVLILSQKDPAHFCSLENSRQAKQKA